LAVFCDFDGTFAVQDIGSTLVRRHAAELRPVLWDRYRRGEISAWEYNVAIFSSLRVTQEELDAFLRTIELDPGARDLVSWCDRNDVLFCVLSDGFDHNLDRLQAIHDLHFAYEANHLEIDAGRWRIEPGRADPSCFCGTGICKRACIEAFRSESPGATVVHIGNGRVSDTCGAIAADLTFAKDTLAEELEARGVPFEKFETLHDVLPVLRRLCEASAAQRSGAV